MHFPHGILLLTLILSLSGCFALGPDYAEPDVGWEKTWASDDLQKLKPKPINLVETQNWWSIFADNTLNDLITKGLKNNNNLKIAGLRVAESRALLAAAQSTLYPQSITLGGTTGYGASARSGQSLSNSDYTFATADFSVFWEMDFWGKFQRGIEANNALYLNSTTEFEDFQTLLISEIARQYFTYRTLEKRLDILDENIKLQKRAVEIATNRFEAGEDSQLNVEQANAQYLSTVAARPVLETSLGQAKNALNALLGLPPGDTLQLEKIDYDFSKIPNMVVNEIPADLLRRRPDVRAASYRAAAASANIGIAKTDLYPSLSLFGTIGVQDTSLGGVSELLSDTVSGAIGPSVSWNIFDFGRLRNTVRVQDARFEQALIAYEETILQAAKEVDDTSLSFVKLKSEIDHLKDSEKVAKRAYDIALINFQEGFSDFQRLLDAQAALLRQQDSLVGAQGQKAVALVLVYKAMAGSWPVPKMDYISDEAQHRMEERTNWGGMLDDLKIIPLSDTAQKNNQNNQPHEDINHGQK